MTYLADLYIWYTGACHLDVRTHNLANIREVSHHSMNAPAISFKSNDSQ